MARNAFRPTEAETSAIREAEAWADLVHSREKVVGAHEHDESDLLTRAKAAAKALDSALAELLDEERNRDRYAGHVSQLLAVLQGSDGTRWHGEPKQEAFALLQRFRDDLRTLRGSLEAVAPRPGAPASAIERRFIMRAADNWLLATGEPPTQAGRFHKCIQDVSQAHGDLSSKKLAPALSDWRALRGILKP